MVLAWCRNGWAGRQSPFLSPWAAFPRPHPAPAHFFGNLGHYFTRNKWWALPLVPSTTFCPPGPHSCRVAACPPVSLLYPEASSSQSCLALCRGCPWPWASPGTAGQLTGWGPGPGRWAGGGPTWALGGGTAGRQQKSGCSMISTHCMHVRFCKTRIVHELSNVFTEINRRIYPKLFMVFITLQWGWWLQGDCYF